MWVGNAKLAQHAIRVGERPLRWALARCCLEFAKDARGGTHDALIDSLIGATQLLQLHETERLVHL